MKPTTLPILFVALIRGVGAYSQSNNAAYRSSSTSSYNYQTRTEENQVVGFVYNEDAACGYPFAEFFITEMKCEEDQNGNLQIDGEQVQPDFQSYAQKYGQQYAQNQEYAYEQQMRQREENQCYLGDRMEISGTVNLTEALYRRFDVQLQFCYKSTDWSWKSTECTTYKASNLNIGGNYYDAEDVDGNVQNYWSNGYRNKQSQEQSKQEWYAEQYQKCQEQQWDGNGNNPCNYEAYQAEAEYDERSDAGLYIQPGEHDWSTIVTVPGGTSKKSLKAGTVVTAVLTITPKKQYSKKAYKQSMYRKNNNMEFSLYHTKCKATFNAGFDQAWYDEEEERYKEEYKQQNWRYYAAAGVGVASLSSLGAYLYFGRKRRTITSVSQEAINCSVSPSRKKESISDSYSAASVL